MKKLNLMYLVSLTLFLNLSYCQNKSGEIFVSLNGNDSWSGSIAEPNKQKSDGPFLTLERAKEAVRSIKKGDADLKITVFLRGGIYKFSKSLIFDEIDSGNKKSSINWSAYKNEEVRFVGGKVITGFKKISDNKILARINKSDHDKILVSDLKSQGITDYGTFPNRLNLYFKGKMMDVARYPNEGWLKIADVPQSGEKLINSGDKKVIKNGYPAGRHFGKIVYDIEQPEKWVESDDIWIHGYLTWDWKDAFQKIERIDHKNHAMYPSEPHHGYGYQKGQRYYFLNVLEELDFPGEWYLDKNSGLLYFYPPEKIKENDVIVSILNEPMLILNNTANITFEKIIFESSRVCAIRINNGSHNVIAGCTIRNIGNDTSIIINGGAYNGVQSCDLYDLGGAGIKITGGDRNTLTPANNFAINNHISRFGKIVRAFNGAIWLEGVGSIISHNKIHDAPFSGIQFYGNDHIMEYNEIFDISHEAGDVGGVNSGADYSFMGIQIKYNYFHNTHGVGHGGFRAIYLDLPGSNTLIYGNILHKVDIGVFFNSGRDNIVKNNVFVECNPSVNIYIWPHKMYFDIGGAWKIIEKLMEIKFREPPYSTKYPKIVDYLNPKELGLPIGNVVENNISYGGKFLDLSETMNFNDVIVCNNYIADTMLLVYTKKWVPDYDPYNIGYSSVHRFGDKQITSELEKFGNIITDKDPGFVDLKNAKFQLKENSPAFKLGFERIPIEKIGIYIDEYRKSIQ